MSTEQILKLLAAILILMWLALGLIKATRDRAPECSERHYEPEDVNELRDIRDVVADKHEARWSRSPEARRIQRELLDELRKNQEPPR